MNLQQMIGIGTLALTLVGGAATLVAPGAEAQAGATCQGQPATITAGVNDVTVNGTPGDDVIVGNRLDNTIFGGPGNDLICAGEGDDSAQGNDGDDEIYGGAENDILLGNSGNDKLFGEAGADRFAGDGGPGTPGNDDLCHGGKSRRDAIFSNAKGSCETKKSIEKVAQLG